MLGPKNYPVNKNNPSKFSPCDLKQYLPNNTNIKPPVFKNYSKHYGPSNYQGDIEQGDIVLFIQDVGNQGLSDTLSCYHVMFARSNKPTGWAIISDDDMQYFKTPQ